MFPLCTQTEPEMVQPSISSEGSNSSIQVSWNKPSGNVEYYTVILKPQLSSQEITKTTMDTNATFDGLSAGRNYLARVVTHSGFRSSSSTSVSNATCKSQTFVVFTKIFKKSIRIFHSTFSDLIHATLEYSCSQFCSDAFKGRHMVPFMLPWRSSPADCST